MLGSVLKKNIVLILAAVLFLTSAGLLISTAQKKSLVYDEVIYAPMGVLYWKTGNLSWNLIHPPLQKLISSLPLLTQKLLDPSRLDPAKEDEWHAGYKIFFQSPTSPLKLILLSRLPSIVVTLLIGLGLLFFFLPKNPMAGLLSATIFLFDPLVLGNGSLAMNDIFVTCFFFLSLLQMDRWRSGVKWAGLFAGVLSGLAIGSKLSGLLLVPIFLILVIEKLIQEPKRASQWIRDTFIFGIGSALTVLTLYRFNLTILFQALHQESSLHQNLLGTGFLLGPFPGNKSWIYYSVATLIKTPLPLLGLWLASLIVIAKNRSELDSSRIWIWAGLAVWSAAMISRNHFGLRYLLPAVPVLAVLVGQGFSRLTTRRDRWLFGILTFWLVGETLFTHPHHMAYFNEFIGGSKNGYKWLDGSNQDWGQDLPALADFLKKENNPSLLLSYVGSSQPEAWGLQYQDVLSPSICSAYHDRNFSQPIDVKKEFLAVSARLRIDPRTKSAFAFLAQLKPVTFLGDTIFVYDISPDTTTAAHLTEIYKETNREELVRRQMKRIDFLNSLK